jgi:hypothetical protein
MITRRGRTVLEDIREYWGEMVEQAGELPAPRALSGSKSRRSVGAGSAGVGCARRRTGQGPAVQRAVAPEA